MSCFSAAVPGHLARFEREARVLASLKAGEQKALPHQLHVVLNWFDELRRKAGG